jgi:hypothetical protein
MNLALAGQCTSKFSGSRHDTKVMNLGSPDAAIGWYRLDGNSSPSGEKISCRRNGGKAQLRIPHRS